MTMQMPPTEPLDEQEREFARIVRALPGGEPPAALDARILRAAANAAASSRRPTARWLASAGALWGIGGAAAAVLALGVSWHMMNPMRSSSAPEPATAPVMADRAEDSSVQVEFKDKPAPQYPAAPPPPPLSELSAAPQRRARANAPQPSAPPPPMAAPAPEPFALDSLDEHVASGAESDAGRAAAAPIVAEREAAAGYASKAAAQEGARAASAKTASAAAQSRARAETAQAQLRRADDRAQAVGAAAPTAGADADAGLLKPADWLNYIRRLRDENRTEEAEASLVEFRRRYPYSAIPPDLAPLMRD